jgi:TRAP-type C4-dicarboxylate transport system permease small subunit
VPGRVATILVSAFVAHTAWHWTTERWEKLRQFPWPGMDAAGGGLLLRWLMVLVAIAAVAWFFRAGLRNLIQLYFGNLDPE